MPLTAPRTVTGADAPPGVPVPVPVTVIAGFLGAGKTTLLNRILAGDHGRRMAVVVNDFGSVDIDSRLVLRRDATMISLDNGCVCCSMAGDLVAQLTRLLEGPDRPEGVVVETSGVSDPGRMLVTFAQGHLRSMARVDGVVTLVDASQAGAIPPGHLELTRRQLAAADVIVFNKADLVSPAELAEVRARLTYPSARMVDAVLADVPFDVLFGLGREVADGASVVERTHTDRFATWSWSCPQPLDLRAVRGVLGSLPPTVFRAKGFLHVADMPAVRLVANVVGRRLDVRRQGGWPAEPRTELVFISLDPGREDEVVNDRLAAAIAA